MGPGICNDEGSGLEYEKADLDLRSHHSSSDCLESISEQNLPTIPGIGRCESSHSVSLEISLVEIGNDLQKDCNSILVENDAIGGQILDSDTNSEYSYWNSNDIAKTVDFECKDSFERMKVPIAEEVVTKITATLSGLSKMLEKHLMLLLIFISVTSNLLVGKVPDAVVFIFKLAELVLFYYRFFGRMNWIHWCIRALLLLLYFFKTKTIGRFINRQISGTNDDGAEKKVGSSAMAKFKKINRAFK